MDLSNLSNDELEALYNFTDRFGKDALRKQLAIPDDYNFSEFAFQRNTLMNAVNEIADSNDFIFYSDNDEIPNLGFSLSNKKLLKTGFKFLYNFKFWLININKY